MATNQDYLRQMANMQNSALQNSALGSGLAGLNQYRSNPLEGYDISSIPKLELEKMLSYLSQEYDRRTMDTPLPSPTRRQLQNNEALKNAYEAMQIVMKLQGN